MDIELGFFLKKMLSSFLMPLSLGLLIWAIGLYYLYQKEIKKAQIIISISFVWMLLISYAPIANTLLSPLEQKYPQLQKESYDKIVPQIEYIVLLGGDAQNRTWEALRLYHLFENTKIITTGHSIHASMSDAQKAANLLIQSGIPAKNILVYNKPKDTKEEVLAIKELLGNHPFILISSAYHLPRAIKLFKDKGLHPIPAPTDWKREQGDRMFSIPDGKQLYKTQRAWHEYLGVIWSNLVISYKTISF